MKAVTGLVGLFVSMPLWYWLMYQVLVRVDASELMWFLFWVYVPVNLFVSAVAKLVDK